jgi:hypothetical protein
MNETFLGMVADSERLATIFFLLFFFACEKISFTH